MKPMICIESIADASISYTFDMGGGDTTSEAMKRLKLFKFSNQFLDGIMVSTIMR